MKIFILEKIASYLQKYRKIFAIQRVEDTIVKIVFDKEETIFFDMKRSNSSIFKRDEFFRAKEYQAPFDILLKKIFTNSDIKQISVLDGNRILQIWVKSSLTYKKEDFILQFEFTGRNTNIIILNQDNIVQEALRHISINNSFREVRVGSLLLALPPKVIKEKIFDIDDMSLFLFHEYIKKENSLLVETKNQKTYSLDKKIDKFQKEILKLEDSSMLLKEADRFSNYANLLLANIHQIKPYQKEITLCNFEGKQERIILPNDSKSSLNTVDIFFNNAKKLRQKAKNNHLEKDNLESKVKFLNSLKSIINNAKSIDEINIYFPKKQHKKDKELNSNIEIFFYENYKIEVGKNEKGNEKLLKDAKKNDIWFHLKDRPSTHVIIKTDKQNIKDNLLDFASKLCVDFSVDENGKYEVDYIPRRNLKIIKGSFVNYVNYKTKIVIK